MIVESMTHTEAYREIFTDIDNLEAWHQHQYDIYRRRALKTHKFPAIWWVEYKSPRHLHYLIQITVTARKYERNHGLMVLVLRKEKRGYTVYLSRIRSAATHVGRTVFLQHVFDQYAKRVKVKKTGIELIKHFFSQQGGGLTMFDNELMGRSVRYNEDRDNVCMAIRDGVIFGHIDDDSFIVNTFVSYDMATGKQKETFDEARGSVLDWDEEIKLLCKKGDNPVLEKAIRLQNSYMN